jgi:hypothetical protein
MPMRPMATPHGIILAQCRTDADGNGFLPYREVTGGSNFVSLNELPDAFLCKTNQDHGPIRLFEKICWQNGLTLIQDAITSHLGF